MKLSAILFYICTLCLVIALFFISVRAEEDPIKTVIPAIGQPPNAPSGLVFAGVVATNSNCTEFPFIYYWSDKTCRSISEPIDWAGENLIKNSDFSNGLVYWNELFNVNSYCELLTTDNGLIATSTDPDFTCGVHQLFGDRWARNIKYRVVYNVEYISGKTELYTEPDNSAFYVGIGTFTRIITQPMIWLQTSGKMIINHVTVKRLK